MNLTKLPNEGDFYIDHYYFWRHMTVLTQRSNNNDLFRKYIFCLRCSSINLEFLFNIKSESCAVPKNETSHKFWKKMLSLKLICVLYIYNFYSCKFNFTDFRIHLRRKLRANFMSSFKPYKIRWEPLFFQSIKLTN